MKLVPCECGCGNSGDHRKMISVRKTSGPPRRVSQRLFRRAVSWQVLPACEKAFVLELRATERCRATADHLITLPRWRRLPYLPRLWNLRRLSLNRRMGDKPARKKAWGLLFVTLRTPRLTAPPTASIAKQ